MKAVTIDGAILTNMSRIVVDEDGERLKAFVRWPLRHPGEVEIVDAPDGEGVFAIVTLDQVVAEEEEMAIFYSRPHGESTP
jgi:hypothetical protein